MQLALDYICSSMSKGVSAVCGLHESANAPQVGLGLGVSRLKRQISFSALGLLAVALMCIATSTGAGQERYEYDPIGRLVRYVDNNNQVTEYAYDAAGNILSVVRGGAASGYVPSLTAVTPNFVRRGEFKALTLSGQRLQTGSLQTSDSALDLSNLRQSSNQILVDLTVGETAVTGPQMLNFANAEGNTSIGITIAPRLPDLTVEPSPLALPPDNAAHLVTLRLSNSDVVAHQVAIVSSDLAKATVSPASASLGAGQTSVQVSVTSKAAGFVNLTLTSATLKPVTVPVFITSDFRGVNTSNAMSVGVVVGDAQPSAAGLQAVASFVSPGVGVMVGSALTDVVPQALPVGFSGSLVIRGANIPNAVQISAFPASGMSLGTATVSSDGLQITVPVTVDAGAIPGPRRVVVTDSIGKLLSFADNVKSQLVLTTGQPTISSIEPLFATAGTTMRLKVRGANLHNGKLVIMPATDLRLDAQPVISADGTELLAYLQIAPLAATGTRFVSVMTPSGQSTAQSISANQLTLVREIQSDITPIFASPVGIQVGSVAAPSNTQTIAPVISPSIGVAVGAFAQAMLPRAGIVGTTVNLVVSGQGLQAVQSVGLVASTGVSLGAFTVNAEGTQLTQPIAIDANALKTVRRLTLQTASGPLSFVYPAEANFLVASPIPDVFSVAPQVIKVGQTSSITIRGSNLRDLSTVRFEPSQGLVAMQPLTVNAEGTLLTFNVQADANAVSGARTVVVVGASGQSSSLSSPLNTLYVAQQTGPTYADISAQSVGVTVGVVNTPPVTSSLDVHASAVGVVVESVPTVVSTNRLATAANVGVLVGAGITGMSPSKPDGLLKGTTASVVFTGVGLDQVTNVTSTGGAGITFGSFAVNPTGTQLTLPVNVSSTATSGVYSVSLFTGSAPVNTKLTSVNLDVYAFSVGALPSRIESVSPIVMEQGKSYLFTVRGSSLQDVYQLVAEPSAGIGVDIGSVQWSTDALGEKLTARVSIGSDAAIGSRVIRFQVPGGMTDAVPVPANTITIVSPQ